jgi:hypothetical protein
MEFILINIFYYLIIFSTIGYGYFFVINFLKFNSELKATNVDIGFIGLSGLFFLILISYFTNFFLSHDKIFNSILLLVGLLFFAYFFKRIFFKNNFLYLILIFFILSIAIFVFKNHDDFPYYHFPSVYHLTQTKIIFGMGNLGHGWRTPSSLFYLHSLFYLPFIEHYLFHIAPILVLGFSNIIILKKIFIHNKKKQFDFIYYLNFLIFIFINVVFCRLSEHGADLSGQILSFILLIKIFEIINSSEIKESNKSENLEKILLLLLLIITFKTFFILYSLFFLYLFLIFFRKSFFWKVIFDWKIVTISLLTILFLIISNLSSSGCFIYPIDFLCIEDLSWALKRSEVISANRWYELWSKGGAAPNYRVLDPDIYILGINWISNWIKIYFFNKVSDTLLGVFAIGIIFWAAFFNFKKNSINKTNYKFVYLIIIILFIEWFFKHPALRYGGYNLVVFIIFIPLCIYMQNFNNNYVSKFAIIISLIFITCLIFYGRNIKRINFEIAKYGYSPIVKPFYSIDENYFRFDKQVKALILNYNNCNEKISSNCLIMSPKVEDFKGYKFFYKDK